MRKFFKGALTVFLTSLLVVDCTQICSCGPPPKAIYFLFYKSATNPDLLQPQSGIYKSSDIKLFEVVNSNGSTTQNTVTPINGQYVFNDDTQHAGYFINYQSSVIQYQSDLKKTLIQLSSGVTDTLNFTFVPSSSYPQQIFYNSKPVWKTGDGLEITITK
jgi:hypothetical protein